MRENRTYGSVRGGQSNLIPSTRLKRCRRFRGLWWRLLNNWRRQFIENRTTALRARKSDPLWWLAPPPLPRWEACHWILSRPRAPYSTAITDSLDSQVASAPLRIQLAGVTPVPLPPRFAGALWVLGSAIIWLSYGDAAGSACREAAYKTHRRRRYHHPQPKSGCQTSEP